VPEEVSSFCEERRDCFKARKSPTLLMIRGLRLSGFREQHGEPRGEAAASHEWEAGSVRRRGEN